MRGKLTFYSCRVQATFWTKIYQTFFMLGEDSKGQHIQMLIKHSLQSYACGIIQRNKKVSIKIKNPA